MNTTATTWFIASSVVVVVFSFPHSPSFTIKIRDTRLIIRAECRHHNNEHHSRGKKESRTACRVDPNADPLRKRVRKTVKSPVEHPVHVIQRTNHRLFGTTSTPAEWAHVPRMKSPPNTFPPISLLGLSGKVIDAPLFYSRRQDREKNRKISLPQQQQQLYVPST